MMSFEYKKAEFEQMAGAYDVCALFNDCSKCRAHVRCLRRWDVISGKTAPYGNLNEREYARRTIEPNYDTTIVSDYLRYYYPGVL